MDENFLLTVKNLKKYFFIKKNKTIKAVDDVSFEIQKGKTFAIVGESGAGKTTIANMLSNLLMPTAGEIFFENKFLSGKDKNQKKNIQMIFQDPYLSLNPKMKIGKIILEPIEIHKKISKIEQKDIFHYLLKKVHLPFYIENEFPHKLSSGQRQRVAIARAIALSPKFIICDEPIASLDASISGQIINLLSDLKKNLQLTYLFISHNLSVVRYISDNIAVMYLGKFLEKAETQEFFNNPLHPYSQMLISFSLKKKISFKNESFILSKNSLNGCIFSQRCPYAKKICFENIPNLEEIRKDHFVACHLVVKSNSFGS